MTSKTQNTQEDIYADIKLTASRPPMLTRLCWMSFFFSGSMTLFSFGGFFMSGWISSYVNVFVKGFHNIGNWMFLLFFLGTFLLFGATLTGVVLMYRKKKAGLWIYLISSGVTLFLSLFVVMNVFNILFILGSILFMVMYILEFKKLRAHEQQ